MKCIETMKTAPKRTNESALAIQPHQADQPGGGQGSGGGGSHSWSNGTGAGGPEGGSLSSWTTTVIGTSTLVALLVVLLALAPIARYANLRPPSALFLSRSPEIPVQRLVGEYIRSPKISARRHASRSRHPYLSAPPPRRLRAAAATCMQYEISAWVLFKKIYKYMYMYLYVHVPAFC